MYVKPGYMSYFAAFRFLLFLSLAKQITKNTIPYTVVMGVAIPMKNSEALGSLDMIMETGIRMQKAEVIP